MGIEGARGGALAGAMAAERLAFLPAAFLRRGEQLAGVVALLAKYLHHVGKLGGVSRGPRASTQA